MTHHIIMPISVEGVSRAVFVEMFYAKVIRICINLPSIFSPAPFFVAVVGMLDATHAVFADGALEDDGFSSSALSLSVILLYFLLDRPGEIAILILRCGKGVSVGC